MTRPNSRSSTEHPDVPDNAPTSSPSLSRRSTGLSSEGHRERRDSKLGHLVDSIRTALTQEQTKLFGDPKAHHHRKYQSSVAERLEKLREQDQTQRQRVEEEIASDGEVEESVSPAVQARERSDFNENNMGAHSSHEAAVRRDSWGWPGLGTYGADDAKEPSTTRRRNSFKLTREKMDRMEPRAEAATYEAIDNAAESESYGWPGLGDLGPSNRR